MSGNESRWLRQTQDTIAPGVVEIVDYESDGIMYRETWWKFWQPKDQLRWQQLGPERTEIRQDEAIEVWFRESLRRDFGRPE